MKKLIALLLAMLMVLSLVACGTKEETAEPEKKEEKSAAEEKSEPAESKASEEAAEPEESVWNLEGTMFPLAEPVTFTVLTQGNRGCDFETIENNKDWQSFCKALNVNFDFVFLGDYDDPSSKDQLQVKLAGGDYGDAIMSFFVDTLTTADISDLASTGILIPLDEYMEDASVMPNFNKMIATELPGIYTNMKLSDGNHYYFAGVSQINAYTADEGLMQVNSEWLKAWEAARNLDHSPATLEEFEDMLKFFAENDLNGDGQQNEIPYFIAQSGYAGCMTLEHAMGMFGISTKDSAADMDIMIDNDKCYYAYTQDNYKAALKQFADWYSKGYVWEDIFTGNTETINEIVAAGANNFGVCNICENLEGFEPLLPPEIDGFEARYHMHPSVRLGVRQPYAVITDKCEHPEIFAAMIDVLYNFENYIRWNNGSYALDNGGIVTDDEGRYVFTHSLDGAELAPEDWSIGAYMSRMEMDTLANFDAKVDIDSYYGEQSRVKGYTLFNDAGIWNPTDSLWPRCQLLEEDAEDYAFMYTDVSTTLAEYRANFVTGKLDVDAKWDEFQDKLKTLGIEDMQAAVQRAYDAFLNK